VIAGAHFLRDLLLNKAFRAVYSKIYLVKLLLLISLEFFRMEKGKSDLKRDLVMLFPDILDKF
jgi:hypothetical protein